jgi:hypothetical protein
MPHRDGWVRASVGRRHRVLKLRIPGLCPMPAHHAAPEPSPSTDPARSAHASTCLVSYRLPAGPDRAPGQARNRLPARMTRSERAAGRTARSPLPAAPAPVPMPVPVAKVRPTQHCAAHLASSRTAAQQARLAPGPAQAQPARHCAADPAKPAHPAQVRSEAAQMWAAHHSAAVDPASLLAPAHHVQATPKAAQVPTVRHSAAAVDPASSRAPGQRGQVVSQPEPVLAIRPVSPEPAYRAERLLAGIVGPASSAESGRSAACPAAGQSSAA